MPTERAVQPGDDPVRLYLNDVGRYRLLGREDEVRLGQAVEAGRQAGAELAAGGVTGPSRQRLLSRVVGEGDLASEMFVTANLRLVVAIAKRYKTAELPLLDRIQEGNLGLIHAVEKYDWRKGFKFSTYATWWIRLAITRGIANHGRTVRLPLHTNDLLNRVINARVRLEGHLGRPATVAELAADLDLDQTRVSDVLRHASKPVSLSEPLGGDGDGELGDVVEDPGAVSPFDAAAAVLLADEVARMLIVLDHREREVLRLRFGLDRGYPRTLNEVGAHFNLTQERIRQMEARAISKLRHHNGRRAAHDLLYG